MCRDEVKSIRYGFHMADLLAEEDDCSRYDIERSAQKYGDLCLQALEQHYPDAEIEVWFDTSASGVLSGLKETQVDGQSDSYEVGAVEYLCDAIYREYKWLVARPWLTVAQAHGRFGVPIPVIRWACQQGLIVEAEKNAIGQWEFPLDMFSEILKDGILVNCEEILGTHNVASVHTTCVCCLEDTLHIRATDFPAGITILVIAPNGFGTPLLSGDNSSVLISRHNSQIVLVLEHFIRDTPWTDTPWSYTTYAKALVSQARQHRTIESEWQENMRAGKSFVEGMQFTFTYDPSLPYTLNELIDQSARTLSDIVQETEIYLSGGPVWKKRYEEDETFFCEEVLAPLLRQMGFDRVRYIHGKKEYGKDFVFSEPTRFGELRHYGLQAKAGNVGGEINSEVDRILGQVKDAFAMPYYEVGSRAPRYISDLVIAISGRFTENAREKIVEKMPNSFIGSVHFWDKEKILALIAKHWANR